MKIYRLIPLILILSGVFLLHYGCNVKNKSITGLKKNTWFISDQRNLALMFISDGSLIQGYYLLTDKASCPIKPFEAKPTRKGLEFKFQDRPELVLKGVLNSSAEGYNLMLRGGRIIQFSEVPSTKIHRIPGRYAEPVFPRVTRTKYTYGYAPGYYASKPVKDLSASAYHEIILDVLNDVTVNMFEDSVRLELDLYTPVDDPVDVRPLLVYIHGGAFVVGDKRDEFARRTATYFAQCGYVVASINYRMGYPFVPGMYSQLERCLYRGIQDVRSAIRYLSHRHKTLRIDPGKVFLAGNSAGGFYSLLTTFMEEGEKWPSAGQSLFGLRSELGCLDCSGNPYKDDYQIIGVVNLWGGITDLTFIDSHEKLPVLLIHGTADRIVPYGYDYPFANVNQSLSSVFSSKVYGSGFLYDYLKDLGFDVRLVPIPGGQHEPQDDDQEVFQDIRNAMTSFLYSVLAGSPLQLDGPTVVSPEMATARYTVSGYAGGDLRWEASGGIIIRNGQNWADVVWFRDSGEKRLMCTLADDSGVVKSDVKFVR